MLCKRPGLNFNYSILFFMITYSLKAVISNLFRLPLHNIHRKLLILWKYYAITKNRKALSKDGCDGGAALMRTLCRSERDKDPFLPLYPATAYAGERSHSQPGGKLLSSTPIMCGYAIFGMGLCDVQTLPCSVSPV